MKHGPVWTVLPIRGPVRGLVQSAMVQSADQVILNLNWNISRSKMKLDCELGLIISVKLGKSQPKNVRQRNNYRTWLFVIIRIRLSNHYIKYNIISKIYYFWICHIKMISGSIRIDWIYHILYMTTNKLRLRLSFSSTGLPKVVNKLCSRRIFGKISAPISWPNLPVWNYWVSRCRVFGAKKSLEEFIFTCYRL